MTNNVVLNKGQQEAVKKLYEFLHNDDLAIIITGSAGTGKSFLINYLVNRLIPEYNEDCELFGKAPLFNSVSTAATTNKAANVINNSTEMFTPTVHSLFNLILKNNYRTGEIHVVKNSSKWHVKTKTLFIIDEYTMINKELFKYILESIDISTCKLVFVGDKNQLTPVKESYCVVDNQGYEIIELTEPVRNSNFPELIDICEQFRNTVETGEFKDIKLSPGIIEHVSTQVAGAMIEKDFRQGKNSRILTYTNRAVINYNSYIRDLMGYKSPKFQEGEVLTVNNMVSGIYQGERINISTDTLIEVVNVGAMDVIYLDTDPNKENISSTNPNDIENSIAIEHYTIGAKVQSAKTGKHVIVYITVPKDMAVIDEAIKYFAKTKQWVSYFFLKEKFADLRPIYASTIHKSQGSTFDTVYIDLNDLSSCRVPSMAKRLFYVAVSRPRTRIVFFGNLNKKYGEFIS